MSAPLVPPPPARLRDHVGDPADPAARAAAVVRALGPAPPLGAQAQARVLATLRGAAEPPHAPALRPVLLGMVAVVVVASGVGAAVAGLGWLRSVPAPAAPVEPARQVRAAVVPLAPEPPPPPASAPAEEATRVEVEVRPGGGAYARPKLAIDPLRPPFRARVPAEIARPGATFSTLLEICVTPEGRVSGVTITRGAHPRLDPEILRVARTWRYHPARVRGRPVAVCVPLQYLVTVSHH